MFGKELYETGVLFTRTSPNRLGYRLWDPLSIFRGLTALILYGKTLEHGVTSGLASSPAVWDACTSPTAPRTHMYAVPGVGKEEIALPRALIIPNVVVEKLVPLLPMR